MTQSKLKIALCAFLVILVIVLLLEQKHIRLLMKHFPGVPPSLGLKPVEDQIARLGPTTHRRLAALFRAKGLEYPPDKLALLVLKDARQLQIYVANGGRPYRFVRSYTVSGTDSAPTIKSNEADNHLPEGVYQISSLEPNARRHLGLRVNYPNDFDLSHVQGNAKPKPESDLLIHGGSPSIGSLAVNDQASEDLFVLTYDTKDRDIPVVVSAIDLRISDPPPSKPHDPPWLPELYRNMKRSLAQFPLVEQRQ
jgi:murein L,D-transpeptidase YafK